MHYSVPFSFRQVYPCPALHICASEEATSFFVIIGAHNGRHEGVLEPDNPVTGGGRFWNCSQIFTTRDNNCAVGDKTPV